MKTNKIVVLPYDKTWKTAFQIIKREIEDAIGDLIIGTEHVGSTSVDGMAAKPCIDIDIIIEDYSVFDEVKTRLALIGYNHEGDLGIKDREAFYYSGKPFVFRPVNRLDRNTSGTVLVAKNARAAAMLFSEMKKRNIGKTYIAIVNGELDSRNNTSGSEVEQAGNGEFAREQLGKFCGEKFRYVFRFAYQKESRHAV